MKSLRNPVLTGIAVFVGLWIVATIFPPNYAEASSKYQDDAKLVQPNPSPGRILNRTKVMAGGQEQEIVAIENVPGVVCTLVRASDRQFGGQATISCIKY